MEINYQTYVSPASEVVEVQSEGYLALSGDNFVDSGPDNTPGDFTDGGLGF